MIDWYDKDALRSPIAKDEKVLDLFRDIANLRHGEVEKKLRADRSLQDRGGYVPTPGGAIRARLMAMPVAHQAAAFGDSRMIRLMHELGNLQEDRGKEPPLVTAAAWRNVETSREMLRLGFDVEVLDEHDMSPLRLAVNRDNDELVALLLKHGANCNRPDNGQMTPIFAAQSVAVAMRLLHAGAALNAVDDEGRTCVQWHLEHGRADIVDVLLAHGAGRDPDWELGLSEEQVREQGRLVLRRHFEQTDRSALAEFELRQAIDYGCVLPVRSIPIAN